MADERRDEDDAPDTEALLDQGERLLAESARLIRRLDAAIGRNEAAARRSRVVRRPGDAGKPAEG